MVKKRPGRRAVTLECRISPNARRWGLRRRDADSYRIMRQAAALGGNSLESPQSAITLALEEVTS